MSVHKPLCCSVRVLLSALQDCSFLCSGCQHDSEYGGYQLFFGYPSICVSSPLVAQNESGYFLLILHYYSIFDVMLKQSCVQIYCLTLFCMIVYLQIHREIPKSKFKFLSTRPPQLPFVRWKSTVGIYAVGNRASSAHTEGRQCIGYTVNNATSGSIATVKM